MTTDLEPLLRGHFGTGKRGLHAYLHSLVQSAHTSPGTKVPAERELVDLFGISRGTVRSVIEGFVAQGYLRRATGQGTYVADQAQLSGGFGLQEVSPSDVSEARILVEPIIAQVAVERATLSHIRQMEHCLEQAENAADWRIFEDWDRALHAAIAQATRNPALARLCDFLAQIREREEWTEIKSQTLSDSRRKTIIDEHRLIVEAIKCRDARAAHDAMLGHLQNVKKHMFNM